MPHFLKRLLPDLSFRRDVPSTSRAATNAHDLHRTRRVLIRNSTTNPANSGSTQLLSIFDSTAQFQDGGGDESLRALRLDGASIAASSIGGVGERHILAESLMGEERGEFGLAVQKRRARRRLSKRHRRPV